MGCTSSTHRFVEDPIFHRGKYTAEGQRANLLRAITSFDSCRLCYILQANTLPPPRQAGKQVLLVCCHLQVKERCQVIDYDRMSQQELARHFGREDASNMQRLSKGPPVAPLTCKKIQLIPACAGNIALALLLEDQHIKADPASGQACRFSWPMRALEILSRGRAERRSQPGSCSEPNG